MYVLFYRFRRLLRYMIFSVRSAMENVSTSKQFKLNKYIICVLSALTTCFILLNLVDVWVVHVSLLNPYSITLRLKHKIHSNGTGFICFID